MKIVPYILAVTSLAGAVMFLLAVVGKTSEDVGTVGAVLLIGSALITAGIMRHYTRPDA